jgi:8-oxo-dGTP diphosphatase
MKKAIEVIARAVVVHNNTILLCRPKDQEYGDYYYFPGGHVEFGESAEAALRREIKEETGADVTETHFIGALENRFIQHNNEEKHEINLVFEAHLASAEIRDREEHIESKWVLLEDCKNARVLPETLKNRVFRWLEDKQAFYGN